MIEFSNAETMDSIDTPLSVNARESVCQRDNVRDKVSGRVDPSGLVHVTATIPRLLAGANARPAEAGRSRMEAVSF